MPRFSISLPPITITKGGAPSVPTPVAIEVFSNPDLGVDVLGVRYSDNSLKLLYVDDSGERAAINPNGSDIGFELDNGEPSFEYLSSTNYEEIGDLYEWIEATVYGKWDIHQGEDDGVAVGAIHINVDSVEFVCQYNIINDNLSRVVIDPADFVIADDTLPVLTILESGSKKALGVVKNNKTFAMMNLKGNGYVKVVNTSIPFIADDGCSYCDTDDAGFEPDNVMVNTSSEFVECNIEDDERIATAHIFFTLFGIDYGADFDVPGTSAPRIEISDLTIVEV